MKFKGCNLFKVCHKEANVKASLLTQINVHRTALFIHTFARCRNNSSHEPRANQILATISLIILKEQEKSSKINIDCFLIEHHLSKL